MIDVTTQDPSQQSMLAAPVAPEDIRVGDYLASMNDVNQFVLRACEPDWQAGLDGAAKPPQLHLVRVRMADPFPEVLRVLAVGLPFVLVEDPQGIISLITCRLSDVARLPPELGRRAMRTLDRRRRKEAAKRREAAAKREAELK